MAEMDEDGSNGEYMDMNSRSTFISQGWRVFTRPAGAVPF